MARSSSTTAATIFIHDGAARRLSSPQPCLSPSIAMLMAVVGSKILMSAVFIATIARLLGQRRTLEYDCERRGAAVSQTAIAVKTAINTPSLIVLSLANIG